MGRINICIYCLLIGLMGFTVRPLTPAPSAPLQQKVQTDAKHAQAVIVSGITDIAEDLVRTEQPGAEKMQAVSIEPPAATLDTDMVRSRCKITASLLRQFHSLFMFV